MKKILFLLCFLVSFFGFAEDRVEEVSPTEDLMREHGVLNRLLLAYQEIAFRIENKIEFPLDCLVDSARIIKTFIEEYHEHLEETYIFPRFKEANKMTDLVQILIDQHNAGRHLTAYILTHAKESELQDDIQRLILADYIKLFIRMYRPHEAREDTVLFPAFKTLISQKEYDALGDLFEKEEQKRFGEDGFNKIVSDVARIEKALNIYNLSKFTPNVKGDK